MVRFWQAWAPLVSLAASPALAAGGAHVIDDSEVEAPGACHLESWITLTGKGGLTDLSPACTRRSWPNLEVGGFALHSWSGGASATSVGIAPKVNLRPAALGLGVGLSATLGFDLDRRRLGTASLIMPITVRAGDNLRFNLNGGWQWSRGDRGSGALGGGQVEIGLDRNLGLMLEGFARDRLKAGCQAGLRWTGHGPIGIDLLVGRYVDGRTPTAVTLGLSLHG